MDLSDDAFDALMAREPVARLATVDSEGHPHIVPIVFAASGDHLYSPIDAKPKQSSNLKRLRNLREQPDAALLIDHYEANWQRLWWVRLDVHADVLTTSEATRREFDAAVAALQRKYPQYATVPVLREEPMLIRMRVLRTVAWSAEDR